MENGGRETVASRAKTGSLHCLPSGICLPLRPSRLCLEAEYQEVTVSASEAEGVCIPVDAVVGREVKNGGLCHHCHIGLVCRPGEIWLYNFECPPELRGRHILLLVEAYSSGGSKLYWWQRLRQKGNLA